MGNWGLSSGALSKEKLKSEMSDFLGGLNSVGKIDYSVYSQMFDYTGALFDKMYDLGKEEGLKTVSVKKECEHDYFVGSTTNEKCVSLGAYCQWKHYKIATLICKKCGVTKQIEVDAYIKTH